MWLLQYFAEYCSQPTGDRTSTPLWAVHEIVRALASDFPHPTVKFLFLSLGSAFKSAQHVAFLGGAAVLSLMYSGRIYIQYFSWFFGALYFGDNKKCQYSFTNELYNLFVIFFPPKHLPNAVALSSSLVLFGVSGKTLTSVFLSLPLTDCCVCWCVHVLVCTCTCLWYVYKGHRRTLCPVLSLSVLLPNGRLLFELAVESCIYNH